LGGEQGRDADVPLPGGAGRATRTLGAPSGRDIRSSRVRATPWVPSHRGQATRHVGPRPRVHLHTAYYVRRRLVRAGARRVRWQRGRHAVAAGHSVYVPRRPIADGPNGCRLPAVRSRRRAHHAQVGGEGDA